MKPSSASFVMLIIISMIVISFSPGVAQRIGPGGRIRVICFGDIIDQYGGYNSFTVIGEDPAIEPTYVPSRADYLGGREDAARNMRIYMPRTYRKLIGDYDIILMSDADRSVFETQWISWLADSVPQGGMGMLWLGNMPMRDLKPGRTPAWREFFPSSRLRPSLGTNT